MIVCDTSVLSYLIQLGLGTHLARRYGKVAIPEAVREELTHPRTPNESRRVIVSSPDWISIRASAAIENPTLGLGEREALSLARILNVPILVDDAAAREEAFRMGLRFSGTLGFIALEAADGHLDYTSVTKELVARGFHASEALIERLRPQD